MRLINHPNNARHWHAKQNEATAAQVAAFAKDYKRGDEASAWAVTVTEGADWIAASHVRDVVDATHAEGAVRVWVSDGVFAQCVWRGEAR